MRKVFLSVMMLGHVDVSNPAVYQSDDFPLTDGPYHFPLTHIIAASVDANEEDSVAIITAVQHNSDGTPNMAERNYQLYQKEAAAILEARHVTYTFIEIPMTDQFDALTFNSFFKHVAEQIQDNDQLYADITFGMKPYSISLFIAIAYAAKAARNVEVNTIIYAQKFSGRSVQPQAKAPSQTAVSAVSKIYDLTGLFYLNSLASNAVAGQKAGLDQLLSFIIDEE